MGPARSSGRQRRGKHDRLRVGLIVVVALRALVLARKTSPALGFGSKRGSDGDVTTSPSLPAATGISAPPHFSKFFRTGRAEAPWHTGQQVRHDAAHA